MPRFQAASALVLATLVSIPAFAESTDSIDLDGGKRALAPITHRNLTLYPVVGGKPTPTRYIVLDEGMKKGLVKVKEKGNGQNADVNELTLVNRSDQPLFLMAGEVVLGGKQDRIIGKNTIIQPNSTDVVPVFCVEHGRWAGRKAEFQSGNALAHKKLRVKASHSDQGKVWEEVAGKNASRGVANDTDTYRRVITDDKVKVSIGGYEKAFSSALAGLKAENVNGFVVALDGRVVAIETFGSPELFDKLKGKLLKSYYVEAVDAANADKTVAPPKPSAVADFQKNAKEAKKASKVVLRKAGAETSQYESEKVQGSVVTDKAAPAGEPVYEGNYE